MNKNSQKSNYPKSTRLFKTKSHDIQEEIKINQTFDIAKLEFTMIKISDFIIIFFYIASFLQFYMFGIATKEKTFNLNYFFYITITFFFLNIMILFAFRILFFKIVKKKKWQTETVELIIKILRYLRFCFLTVYLLISSIYLSVNMKASMDNSEIIPQNAYEKNIYFLLYKYYQINLISTILYVLSNIRENIKITILHIILMFIPNFFSLVYWGLYWDEITNLICFIFILFFIISIRETIFEFFLNSKGFNNVIEKKIDSKIKFNNNEIINAENEKQREKSNINFSKLENSNNFYFDVVNDKINLICENLKFFIFETIFNYSNKFTNKYEDLITLKKLIIDNIDNSKLQNDNENQEFKKPVFNDNDINQAPFNIKIDLEENLNLYLRGLKLFKTYEKGFKEEEIKNFINSVNKNLQENTEFKKISIDKSDEVFNRENFLKNKQILNMDDIKFSNEKDIEGLSILNKGDSILTLIDNIININKKTKNLETNLINVYNLELNKPSASKFNIQKDNKQIRSKNLIHSNLEVNNSSCQNIISLENKNILDNLKKNKQLSDYTSDKRLNIEIGTKAGNKNKKITKKYLNQESSQIIKSNSELKTNIKNKDKIISSNLNTALFQAQEIKDSIIEQSPNYFEAKYCFLNIGIYKLNLSDIFDSKENSNPLNKSIFYDENRNNFYKESFNIIYLDVSIILSFTDSGRIRIEICMKNVSNYFNSYEKLKRKLISNSLKISKLIHEFKTPINCIIGLSSEIQILTEKELNSKSYKNLKEDIDRIQHLSNYTVYLIKDFMSFLSISQINNKNEENKNLSNLKSNSNSNIEDKQLNISGQNQSTVKRNAKRHKYISSNKLIELQNSSLIEILNFAFSILTSLIKCSKLKKENIQPLLTVAEEINFIYISTDDIKFKQILLNLISNSVKFTNSGFIEIEAKYGENELNLNKNIEIIIKDTGIGINKNQQHKLFQDYANIKIEKNKKIDNQFGTGLGLSLSKQIAKQLGIDLIYDSDYNEGTKFVIRIPFEKYQISKEIIIIDRDESKYINIKNTSYDNYNIKDSCSTLKNVNDQINISSNYQNDRNDKSSKSCNVNVNNYKFNNKVIENDKNNICNNNYYKNSIISKTDRKNFVNKSNSTLNNKKTTHSSDSQRNTLNNLKLNTDSKSDQVNIKEDTSIKQIANSISAYNHSNKITRTYSSKIIFSPYLNSKVRTTLMF